MATAFVEPAYEAHHVDLAGEALIGMSDAIDELSADSLDLGDIVNNWRSAHHYPLNTFQMTLRNRAAKVDSNSIVAQRVKRLSSVEGKLKRYHSEGLSLSEVQDIAGCRAIVESVELVDQLVAGYKEQYSTHTLASENDYIRSPKRSGYRGYHLIYRYKGKAHPEYNDLKVEMQFRTALQHSWATAVEATDIFYGEGLKSSRGSEDWTRFFALMGSAMAQREGCRLVPHTPRDHAELIKELKGLERKLRVRANLRAFGETLRVIDESALTRTNLKWVILACSTTPRKVTQPCNSTDTVRQTLRRLALASASLSASGQRPLMRSWSQSRMQPACSERSPTTISTPRSSLRRTIRPSLSLQGY